MRKQNPGVNPGVKEQLRANQGEGPQVGGPIKERGLNVEGEENSDSK